MDYIRIPKHLCNWSPIVQAETMLHGKLDSLQYGECFDKQTWDVMLRWAVYGAYYEVLAASDIPTGLIPDSVVDTYAFHVMRSSGFVRVYGKNHYYLLGVQKLYAKARGRSSLDHQNVADETLSMCHSNLKPVTDMPDSINDPTLVAQYQAKAHAILRGETDA